MGKTEMTRRLPIFAKGAGLNLKNFIGFHTSKEWRHP